MKLTQRLLTTTMILFMVFAISGVSDDTFGYWSIYESSPNQDSNLGNVDAGS